MRLLVFLLCCASIAVIASACGSTVACQAPCVQESLEIVSGADDLETAVGCGAQASCGAGGCDALSIAPPSAGGACAVVVTFVDGTSQTVDVDWGAPQTGACGCKTYERPPAAVHVHDSDGGAADAGLVAQCEAQAKHFATLCAGEDVRPCMWNAYAELCATGKTQLLVDSMNCLDQTTCRTFSDPNDGETCLASVHATGESQASKDFIQSWCTACGDPCPDIGGDAEVVPYLTDADVASVGTCSSDACAIGALIQQCASVPDVGDFASCGE